MKIKYLFFIVTIAVVFISCGKKKENKINSSTTQKQLNISILLDLSDRINPQKNHDVQVFDIENIKTITEYFKSNMSDLGAYNAKGKIRVFFSPPPSNPNINAIVTKLNIDCSMLDNKKRKHVYDTITELYQKYLNEIYKEAIATSAWKGSDIWRFFKDDAKDFCVSNDTTYRNILIILTDGYLYHKQSLFNHKNRYTYLLGNTNLMQYRNKNWEKMVEQNDFGILTACNNLNNLEVLVLGIKAENPSHKIDEDILQFLWKKWFKEMNIAHNEAYHLDLPANTKTRIENFLKSK